MSGLAMEDISQDHSLSLGYVDTEEQIKIFAVRLAFLEKLASRIAAVAVVWGTSSVLSAFGSALNVQDVWVVSALILVEAWRLLTRIYEVELQGIVRTSKELDKSTGLIASDPGLRRLHDIGSFSYSSKSFSRASETKNASSPLMLTKGGFSFIPIPWVSNVFKPWALSRILPILKRLWGAVGVGLPIWRLVKNDFCESDGARCIFSAYLFYGLTIPAAFLFLLEQTCFEYRRRFTDALNSAGQHLHVDAAMLEIFSNKVYDVCLRNSIYDGFDTNLAVFGISWLQSNDYDQRLHGARILNGVILAKREGKYKSNSATAQVVERLGTYPGLIEMLVANLSWNSELEEELVDEIVKIVDGLVATDQNCSRFAVTPGALEALANHLVSRAKKSNMEHAVDEAKPYLHILCCLAASKFSSGRALRQRIAGIRDIVKILGHEIEDYEKPDLRQLSVEILYHLALEKNARSSIGETAGVIQSLFNLFQQGSNSESRPGHEASRSSTFDNPQSENRVVSWSGMVLSRLMLQTEVNCKTLMTLEDTHGSPLVRVMKASLQNLDDDIAASAAEILRSVWEYADESTKKKISESTEEILLRTIREASTQSVRYVAGLGLASRALPVEKYEHEISEARFMERLVWNLENDPESNPDTTKVPKARRYSIELLIAIIGRTKYFHDLTARSNLEMVLKKTLESTCKAEDYILRSGDYGCGRHAKTMKSLCEEALRELDEAVAWS